MLDETVVNKLFDAVKSTTQKLNRFASTEIDEPWNSPGKGLYCSVTLGPLRPQGARSGLNKTSGTLTLIATIWAHGVPRTGGRVDPQVLAAAVALMRALSADLDFGDFGLAGTVRNIDLMSMSADPGWADFQDAKYRVVIVTVPVVLNDMFAQSAGGDG